MKIPELLRVATTVLLASSLMAVSQADSVHSGDPNGGSAPGSAPGAARSAASPQVNLPPRIVTGTIVFKRQTIGAGLLEVHDVVGADFDADGDNDAAAADYQQGKVFWYENNGNGGFIEHIVDPNLPGAYPLHVRDIDEDGDIDLFVGAYLSDFVVWYQNNGSGGFTRRNIDTAADGVHSVVAGDIDKDGDLDLLGSNQDDDTIAWYENNGAEVFTRHTIDTTADGAKRAEMADLDGDGDLDVLEASYFGNQIAWLQNNGNQVFTKRIIGTTPPTANGAYYAFPADVDGDHDLDVLTASAVGNAIALYRNNGTGTFTETVVDANALAARTVIAADIDGDGDQDPIAASVGDNTVAWYKNDGTGNFLQQEIDFGADGAYGVFAIDFDHDGDLDVLSADRDDHLVALNTQIKAHAANAGPGNTLVIDATLLRTLDGDDGPSGLTYTITDAPDFGQVRKSGVVVPLGGTFTQGDVDNRRVTYVRQSASMFDVFAFTVADGGESGVRPGSGTFRINFVAPSDALAVLPLDEGVGTTATDISGSGHHGMLMNGAAYAAGTGDGSAFAASLDGLDDFIGLGSLDAQATGLTLAAWFKADSYPGSSRDPRLISKASGTAEADHIFMLGTVAVGAATRLRCRLRTGGSPMTMVATSGDLPIGQWHHAAMTYDGVSLRLYLDAVEVASIPRTGAVDVAPSVQVAVGGQPPGAGSRFFDGLIDDVRILQRALSPAEIAGIIGGPGDVGGLLVGKNPNGTLQLTWQPDCGTGTAYAIYRGVLGTRFLPPLTQVQCSVSGTTATVMPGPNAEGRLFLVVPRTATSEGSYGFDSSGVPRPPASSACAPQNAIDSCAIP